MPKIHFQVQWPDGSQEMCYSPSLIVQKYFVAGNSYTLDDFIDRSRTSLTIASDRVLAKYGMPCSKALAQLQHIEEVALRYAQHPEPKVWLIQFLE